MLKFGFWDRVEISCYFVRLIRGGRGMVGGGLGRVLFRGIERVGIVEFLVRVEVIVRLLRYKRLRFFEEI